MSGVTLRIDAARWRAHLTNLGATVPGLVPVIKGNGYGFTLPRLAAEAERLGVPTVAVGLAEEVAPVREHFGGDIVVLTPWRPDNPVATALLADESVITTVSRLADVAELGARERPPRVLLEVLTSMRRHGIAEPALVGVLERLGGLRVEGWTIHLPLLATRRYAEAERLAGAAVATLPAPLWLSHLPVAEATALVDRFGDATPGLRLRVGTSLWLGAPTALATTATVLDVHPVRKGERAGYRQRRVPGDGFLVVISGGTSHGISLEAPTPAATLRQRAIALASGGLEAAGRALSPYTLAGRKRWFLEPPHMQSSLVFLPRTATPPAVGDEIPVQLRLTTAAVDHVVLE